MIYSHFVGSAIFSFIRKEDMDALSSIDSNLFGSGKGELNVGIDIEIRSAFVACIFKGKVYIKG